jgi:hypothetical protein
MRQVKIGDEVQYLNWRGSCRTAIVESIEICRIGEKYGTPVSSCDIGQHCNGTIGLSDNHWCYFDQVKQITKAK